ncbi:PAS domain-containing sensor histidine kinase [Leptospira yasudae]|uniref:histidine kinase n=1 Tax=Leptospira yasudae TaxID=2202201 RepID=A0ABX9LZ16_9LEPT|nr:ATP-binding protein [Leptospira yasudae]RHX78128.1 PAS domain-containing sensor histidine kinase [Leptospira yasudae]RHX91097.1 PAS domain-containing sensor histidine kinase [Leptospira yasudae]TGK26330.1 PAS domain S-box protein [Leptospira yasudae]TGM08615.1 PAS domain S-box protein [Leptospira yasudae]
MPVFSDTEKDFSVRLMYGIMLTCLAVALSYRILHPIFAEKPKAFYVAPFLFSIAVIVTHLIAKTGRILLASHVLVAIEWAAAFTIMLREGASQTVVFPICLILILISALLLGIRAAYFYTFLTVAIGTTVTYLMQTGTLKPVETASGPWSVLLGEISAFILIAVLMKYTLSGFTTVKSELSEIQRYAKFGGWSLNTKTLELTLTKEYQYLLGYEDAKESKTIPLSVYLNTYVANEEEKTKILSILSESLKQRENPDYTAEFIFQIRRRDGEPRFLAVKARFRDSIVGFGTAQDITEKHLAEEALRPTQEIYSKVFTLSPIATSISTADEGKYLEVNDSFLKLFGYTREEVIGKTSLELKVWPDPNERRKYLEKMIRQGIVVDEEVILQGKNGKVVHSECYSAFAEINGKLCAINLVKDLSEKKEAESLRRLNREISDQNELIEKQKQELEGILRDLKKTQNQLIISEKMAALGQLVAGIAHEINNPIGVIKAANDSIQNYFERSTDRMTRVSGILRDLNKSVLNELYLFLKKGKEDREIVSPKEARAKIKELEIKLKTKGFDNPHSSAQDLVESGLENSPEEFPNLFSDKNAQTLLHFAIEEIQAAQSSKLIDMSVNRTSKVVYALRKFTHWSGEGVKTSVVLAESIETVLTIYQNQLKVGVEIHREYEDVPPIQGYADDLIHVWTNLVYNAAQAMSFKGSLTIGIARKGANEVEVSVADTGPGIPAAVQERIFEPFFTTKAPGEGSGLGLDIASRIIETHGGTIRFETSSSGTTFFVRLPIS